MPENIHKTMSVGRKHIAFGLEWFVVEADEAPQKAAAALAKQSSDESDLFVLRKGEHPQFALAATHDGARPGATSGAAALAEMFGSDAWLYVMEIGSDTWVACGRDGYVLPDGDRVFSNVHDAQKAVKELNPSSFKRIYLPPSWREESPRGDESGDISISDFHEFLTYDFPKWGKLTKSSLSIKPTHLLLAVALLGAIGFGAKTLLFSGPSEPDQEAIARAMENLREQEERERQRILDELANDRPWANFPPASALLSQCLDEISTFPSHPVGYKIRTITCAPGAVDAELTRTTGYSSWLEEWGANYPGYEISTDATGTSGAIMADTSVLPNRASKPVTEEYDDFLKSVMTVAQIEGAGATIGQPTARTLPEYPDYHPTYASAPFEIKTTRPYVWVETLEPHDGLALSSVTYDIAQNAYTLEGTLYVNNLSNPLP